MSINAYMLDIKDILIIGTRLILELISYYNAKIMYTLTGMSRISPILTLYITHSMGTFLFIRDIFKHKGNYFNKIKRDTQISPKTFIYNTLYLSLFYNLCHIPKFYAMNSLSDISIVSIYGSSVLFTYLFAVFILNSRMNRESIVSFSMGVFGVFLLLLGDESIKSHGWLTVILFISSIFSGLYGVLFKLAMKSNLKKDIKITGENSESETENKTEEKDRGNIHVIGDPIIEVPNEIIMEQDENKNRQIKENIDFYNISRDESIISPQSTTETEMVDEQPLPSPTEKYTLFKHDVSKETYRKILFMRHYLALTGAMTFALYWPGLAFVKIFKIETLFFPTKFRPLLHVCIANTASLVHNVVYFLIVSSRSPLFAQISGIILQPTFLFIRILRDSGIDCFFELTGCILSFLSFLTLSNSH